MTLRELLSETEVLEWHADPDREISGISYDSRKTGPGDLFAAIRGFETDGHRFIPAAVERGAAAVLCEETPTIAIPWVRVANAREAMAQAAAAFYGYPARELKVVGITGTSGKTTVSTLLKRVAEQTLGGPIGLIGTNGIFIGDEAREADRTTPESPELQRFFREMRDAGCRVAIMEVSSHALELHRVTGTNFYTAIYTNLSQDHLDFHGDMDHYAAAKRKLFRLCEKACFNADDDHAAFMEEGCACPTLRFGMGEGAELRALDPELLPDRVRFTAELGGKKVETELLIPAAFSVSNALAVLAGAYSLGIPLEESTRALKGAGGVRGRLETVETDGEYRILIDYSHKPDALEKVLKSLRPGVEGRLICLFGCGGDRDRSKRPMMGEIATRLADLTILTSDNPRTEDPDKILDEIEAGIEKGNYLRIADRQEAIRHAIELAGRRASSGR